MSTTTHHRDNNLFLAWRIAAFAPGRDPRPLATAVLLLQLCAPGIAPKLQIRYDNSHFYFHREPCHPLQRNHTFPAWYGQLQQSNFCLALATRRPSPPALKLCATCLACGRSGSSAGSLAVLHLAEALSQRALPDCWRLCNKRFDSSSSPFPRFVSPAPHPAASFVPASHAFASSLPAPCRFASSLPAPRSRRRSAPARPPLTPASPQSQALAHEHASALPSPRHAQRRSAARRPNASLRQAHELCAGRMRGIPHRKGEEDQDDASGRAGANSAAEAHAGPGDFARRDNCLGLGRGTPARCC